MTTSVLFVEMPTYLTPPAEGFLGSDSIGFGITTSRALQAALRSQGHPLSTLTPRMTTHSPRSRVQALLRAYLEVCDRALVEAPDAILLFHVLHTLPSELRRAMADLRLDIPVYGYSHGSHWDPTDYYREEVYPGLALADLANLACLDHILLVSDYMRNTLVANISELNPTLADRLHNRMHIVGLPLDVEGLERSRARRDKETVNVLYNHALIPAKRPDLFVAAARIILRRYEHVTVTITRRPLKGSPIEAAILRLEHDFGARVRLGTDMRLDAYFSELWRSAIQVSTAEHESLGVGTLEAMYTGACCLLPDRCCYPEIVGPVREVLFDPKLDGLVDALIHAIEDYEFRSSVGQRLSERACAYSPEKIGAQVSAVLEGADRQPWHIRRPDWRPDDGA